MRYYLIFFFFFLMNGLFAQKVSFVVHAPDSVAPNEVFSIEYKINKNASSFDKGELIGLEIVNGPTVSTSSYFINGEMSFEKTFTFYVKANDEGLVILPEASIQVGTDYYRTSMKNIHVKEGYKTPKQSSYQDMWDSFWDVEIDDFPKVIPRDIPSKYSKKRKTYRV